MAHHRTGKLPPYMLVTIAVIASGLLCAVEFTPKLLQDPHRSEKINAVYLTRRAFDLIKEERLRKYLPIDPQDDPNRTGIIGLEYTDLTTTIGSLSSKRTATNPSFAAVIVEMLIAAGVKSGDSLSISFSSSFPALNIMVLAAAHALNLQPVILSSLGASMYGANLPEFTWLDMEKVLSENGLLPYKSMAASLGGIIDSKGGLDGQGIALGMKAIHRCAIPYLDERGISTLSKDIERRMELYTNALWGKFPAAFINVGGNDTALGNCPEARNLSTGLLSAVPVSKHPQRGIIFRMAERGVPVIHFLQIKKIAMQYGLPIDPVPLPTGLNDQIMVIKKYSRSLAAVSLFLLVCFLVFIKRQLKHR